MRRQSSSQDRPGYRSHDVHDLILEDSDPDKHDIYVVKSGATTGIKLQSSTLRTSSSILVTSMPAVRCDRARVTTEIHLLLRSVSEYFRRQVGLVGAWNQPRHRNGGARKSAALFCCRRIRTTTRSPTTWTARRSGWMRWCRRRSARWGCWRRSDGRSSPAPSLAASTLAPPSVTPASPGSERFQRIGVQRS